jgi:hypothetical protein
LIKVHVSFLDTCCWANHQAAADSKIAEDAEQMKREMEVRPLGFQYVYIPDLEHTVRTFNDWSDDVNVI